MILFGCLAIDIIFLVGGVALVGYGIYRAAVKTYTVKECLATSVVGVIMSALSYFGLAELVMGVILLLSSLPLFLPYISKLSGRAGVRTVNTGLRILDIVIGLVSVFIGIMLIIGTIDTYDGGLTDGLIRLGGVIAVFAGVLSMFGAGRSAIVS